MVRASEGAQWVPVREGCDRVICEGQTMPASLNTRVDQTINFSLLRGSSFCRLFSFRWTLLYYPELYDPCTTAHDDGECRAGPKSANR